jgi:uncharacterized protein (DUF934 family)
MALIRSLPSDGPARPGTPAVRKYALADADAWTVAGETLAPDADVIVPLARLAADAEAILSRAGRTGVRLPNDRGVDPIVPMLSRLSLVAIEFPKHTDGRGYTLARLLRERHAFTGEIRAVGNILRDNLLFLHRCGFDAFELDPKYGPGGLDPAGALSAFDDFDVFYQAASDVRLPLWKRVQRV